MFTIISVVEARSEHFSFVFLTVVVTRISLRVPAIIVFAALVYRAYRVRVYVYTPRVDVWDERRGQHIFHPQAIVLGWSSR